MQDQIKDLADRITKVEKQVRAVALMCVLVSFIAAAAFWMPLL